MRVVLAALVAAFSIISDHGDASPRNRISSVAFLVSPRFKADVSKERMS